VRVTLTYHYDGKSYEPCVGEFDGMVLEFGGENDLAGMVIDDAVRDIVCARLRNGQRHGRFGYDGGYFEFKTGG